MEKGVSNRTGDAQTGHPLRQGRRGSRERAGSRGQVPVTCKEEPRASCPCTARTASFLSCQGTQGLRIRAENSTRGRNQQGRRALQPAGKPVPTLHGGFYHLRLLRTRPPAPSHHQWMLSPRFGPVCQVGTSYFLTRKENKPEARPGSLPPASINKAVSIKRTGTGRWALPGTLW